MSTCSDSICDNTFETSHVRFIHENLACWLLHRLIKFNRICWEKRPAKTRPNLRTSFCRRNLKNTQPHLNTGTGRQSECGISCSEPMPKLSYGKRFSMSRRRYCFKFQNDQVIIWCSIWHFAFDRLETSVNEILSNLIVYSLKCTKNRHRLSYTKTLAHYLVCRFMQWSMTVTYILAGGMGLARCIASLWPSRIWFPSRPKASPPSWFQADVLFSSAFICSWSSVCSSSECLLDHGFRSRRPVSQSGSRRCILGFWVIEPRARIVVFRGISVRWSRVSL